MKSSGVSEVFFPFPPFLNVNSLRDTIVASCVTKNKEMFEEMQKWNKIQ